MAKQRKIRSDIKIGTLEKRLGLQSGSIRNPDGSDARSDKKLGTLRKDFENSKNIKTNPSIPAKTISKAQKAVEAVINKRSTTQTSKSTAKSSSLTKKGSSGKGKK